MGILITYNKQFEATELAFCSNEISLSPGDITG